MHQRDAAGERRHPENADGHERAHGLDLPFAAVVVASCLAAALVFGYRASTGAWPW